MPLLLRYLLFVGGMLTLRSVARAVQRVSFFLSEPWVGVVCRFLIVQQSVPNRACAMRRTTNKKRKQVRCSDF